MALKDKTVILFGAGAIASGYARLFANQAHHVVVVSRGQSCERLVDELKEDPNLNPTGEIISLHADASDFEQLAKVYDDTLQRFGRIDIVVNGSGGNRGEAVFSSLDEFIAMKPEVAQSIMAANYLSKRYSLQLYARYLKSAGHQGSVVNITSMSGLQPLSKVLDYSASFAAVENLTLSVAHLFGKCGIGRVNNLAVGFTIGEQNRKLLTNEDGSPTPRAKEIMEGTSISRFLETDEIAPHVVYLADDARSGAINGITLRVDGGFGLVNLPSTSGYQST